MIGILEEFAALTPSWSDVAWSAAAHVTSNELGGARARATEVKRWSRLLPDVRARERARNQLRDERKRLTPEEKARRVAARRASRDATRAEREAGYRKVGREGQRRRRAATPLEQRRARNVLDQQNKRARDAGVRAGLAFRLNELAGLR